MSFYFSQFSIPFHDRIQKSLLADSIVHAVYLCYIMIILKQKMLIYTLPACLYKHIVTKVQKYSHKIYIIISYCKRLKKELYTVDTNHA